MAEVFLGMAGAGEDLLDCFVVVAGDFEDQGTVEMGCLQFGEESVPLDRAVAWGQMGIPIAMVVVDVDQFQVAGEFVDDQVEFAGEVGVAGVEAGADVGGSDFAEEVEQVADVAEHQVAEHVFEQQGDAEGGAVAGDVIDGAGGEVHVLDKLVVRWLAFAFRAGVEDHVLAAEGGGRIAGDGEFVDGSLARGVVERGDVDAIGEGGVEGDRGDAEGAEAIRGVGDVARVVIVEVGGKRADFDVLEAGIAERFEDVGEAAAEEATGGQGDGPVVHGLIAVRSCWRQGSSEQEVWLGRKQKPFSWVEVQLKSTRRSMPAWWRQVKVRV